MDFGLPTEIILTIKFMLVITNINKEVIFHKMVFESRNLGPSASNSACGSTAKKATVITYHCLLLFVVCAFPERCLHISSRCLHTSSPLSASQSPSVDTDTAH